MRYRPAMRRPGRNRLSLMRNSAEIVEVREDDFADEEGGRGGGSGEE